MAYNQYDLVNTSLVKTGGLTECYIPLWVYSSGSASTSGSSTWYLQKGTNTPTNTITGSAIKLHTLSANWSPTQKFALECSIENSTTGQTSYAALYDIASSQIVTGSQISSSVTSFTLVRGSSFTLTPSHTYAVAIWCTSGYCYLTKASLIAFLS